MPDGQGPDSVVVVVAPSVVVVVFVFVVVVVEEVVVVEVVVVLVVVVVVVVVDPTHWLSTQNPVLHSPHPIGTPHPLSICPHWALRDAQSWA